MKRLFLFLILVLTAVFSSGCTGGGSDTVGVEPEERTWLASATEYELRDHHPEMRPQEGYCWLRVTLRVSNLTQKEQYLFKRFYFVAANGNEYSQTGLIRSNFPAYYKPQQVLSGTVYFEIPESYDPSQGVVIFSATGNTKDTVIELAGVSEAP